MATEDLHLQVKQMIIETLKIKNVAPEQIDDDEMLFESEQLDLDSLDGLELVMAIQKTFEISITDQNHAVTILRTVRSIAEFIESQR